ncbi:MAG TPA: glycosyltransferase family A protein [Planctomycetota bacterium]|nr:glycosyltransferase family A protein [Planctomycetota bacterium]
MVGDVTVVIPAYNAAPSIRDTLTSIFYQVLKPTEVIVVDDCSNDETISIARSFGPAVRLIKVRSHLGRNSVLLNKGIKAAQTSFIQVFYPGDTMHSEMLHRLCNLAMLCPGIQAAFCDASTFRPPDLNTQPATQHEFKKFLQPLLPAGQNYYLLCQPLMLEGLMHDFVPGEGVLFFSKEAWSWAGGYDESLNYAEDMDFAFKLARRYAFGYVDQKLIGRCRREPEYPAEIERLESTLCGLKRYCNLSVSPAARRAILKRISETEVELAWLCSDAGRLADALAHWWKGWAVAGARPGMFVHSRKLCRHFVTLLCKRALLRSGKPA